MGTWKSSKRAGEAEGSMQPEGPMQTEVGPGRDTQPGKPISRLVPGWLLGVFAGILFLAIGAAWGQMAVIWRKAVMICLECIGIG